ncbi:gamma-glutamyltransferase [Streptomyces sp. JJ66]|uniref:gamma-glutamyltransferase family protein n=1 Tax=Streptomyces sp. JJ66 TaxID=2803843 RepID=UPI001C55F2C4|nr:gamma-glutamyltransferase [Streptomyces sp. JJ66]MBW1600576.1 gamma-glutamyltransferase [Streptomyces sp. JJ66]
MFDEGGNAFDAAVAAAFVIQVVEPHLNGPAGDVPILVHDGRRGTVDVICGQGPMPAGATVEHFRGLGLRAVPGAGLLAACVPGAFGAWLTLLRDHGRLPLATVLAPAVHYAREGFPLLPKAAAMIEVMAPLFRAEWPESGAAYLRPDGSAPRAGELLRNPALAATYERLLAEAATARGGREAGIEAALRGFYEGFVAEAIDRYAPRTAVLDATGHRNQGVLSGADLAGWRPPVEAPVAREYRGHLVHKPGPWSQGPVFLQQLALLEGAGLDTVRFGSADHLHTVVEAAKLAFADREAWYGDPAFTDVPLEGLLDAGYAAERRALIGREASAELRPGSPAGRPPRLPDLAGDPDVRRGHGWRDQLADGIPAVVLLSQAKGDTCCVTASDREGNMVAATPSGGWLKSSPVVPGLGFPLGTRGQMAWLDPGHPNALAPGKRPRTTLSPSLVLRDGAPYLAFGTPGGDQQDQWTLNAFLAHVDFGLGPQEAVEARTFHTDHVPSSFTPRTFRPGTLVAERGFDAAVLAELRARGHEVREVEAWSLGKVCMSGARADGGVLAAASPRGRQAYAVVR